MYLGIDVGGTKTLVATLDKHGVLKEHLKFPTPKSYDTFLKQLKDNVESLGARSFIAAGVGIPATEMDHKNGVGIWFGNLPWRNAPIKADIKRLLRCPVVVENDAKLAGLYEAMLVKNYSKVLYITISTGIGFALIVDQKIDVAIGDGGGRTLMLEHQGRAVPWESFASGKAILEQYGKLAKDIHDPKIWQTIAKDLASGLIEVIAITEPDLIIIGGGVGTYLSRFIEPLTESLKHFENSMLAIPPIKEAARPEEAVAYGCYDLARVTYG